MRAAEVEELAANHQLANTGTEQDAACQSYQATRQMKAAIAWKTKEHQSHVTQTDEMFAEAIVQEEVEANQLKAERRLGSGKAKKR